MTKQIISPEGLRIDGRRPFELRRIKCELSPIEEADGSCLFSMGNSKVIVSILGPAEPSRRYLSSHDRAVLITHISQSTFSSGIRRIKGRKDRQLLEYEAIIKETFESVIMMEKYPRSEININVQILQSDGGLLATIINATTMALIHSGIQLLDYVCSCTASQVDSDGSTILDLNYLEEAADIPILTLGIQLFLKSI